jgi:hypothetical protein
MEVQMDLKHFKIKDIEPGNTKTPTRVNIEFLNSQAPIPGQELFDETQRLIEAIEEANKKGIKVNVIIGKE